VPLRAEVTGPLVSTPREIRLARDGAASTGLVLVWRVDGLPLGRPDAFDLPPGWSAEILPGPAPKYQRLRLAAPERCERADFTWRIQFEGVDEPIEIPVRLAGGG
jgi:hypothetical protein